MRIITIEEILPKERGVLAPYQDPQVRGPALRRRAPELLALKASVGLCTGEPEDCRKQELSF